MLKKDGSLNFMCIGEFEAFGLLDRAYRNERSYHTDEYNRQCTRGTRVYCALET